MLCGTPPEQLRRFGLVPDPGAYKYLASGAIPAEGKDDSNDFVRLLEALRILKFSNEEIQSILQILSGILLLGNVEFVGTEKVRTIAPLLSPSDPARPISRIALSSKPSALCFKCRSLRSKRPLLNVSLLVAPASHPTQSPSPCSKRSKIVMPLPRSSHLL